MVQNVRQPLRVVAKILPLIPLFAFLLLGTCPLAARGKSHAAGSESCF